MVQVTNPCQQHHHKLFHYLASEHVLLEHLSCGLITATQIKTMTQHRLLPRVLYFVQNWWPATVEPTLTPYASGEYKLSLFDGCVLWEIGVVVPIAGCKRILDGLHKAHQGASWMKARACTNGSVAARIE